MVRLLQPQRRSSACSGDAHCALLAVLCPLPRCVQFPISQSMPWLCTEFLINTPSMKENIFFPIDIYNDAAAQALYGLKQQFLYDEIEAELNLSFEQLLYAL